MIDCFMIENDSLLFDDGKFDPDNVMVQGDEYHIEVDVLTEDEKDIVRRLLTSWLSIDNFDFKHLHNILVELVDFSRYSVKKKLYINYDNIEYDLLYPIRVEAEFTNFDALPHRVYVFGILDTTVEDPVDIEEQDKHITSVDPDEL